MSSECDIIGAASYCLKSTMLVIFIIIVNANDVRRVGFLQGEKAYIPCNLTSKANIRDITIAMWYKGNITQPVYTLDSRDGDLSEARRLSSSGLIDRGYFNVTIKPPSLVISAVQFEDVGIYTCRVDFRSSRTFTDSSRLYVIVPPEKPIIRDKFGDLVPHVIGPYNEGEPLVLICETSRGIPRPRLRWWKGTLLIDDTDRQLSNDVIRNELVISSLDRTNLLSALSCTASNNNLTTPPQTTIKVDVNFKPKSVRILDKNGLSAGKTALLHCISTGSRPPAHISWWKVGTKLTHSEQMISKDESMTTSILKITPSSDDNGKYISCRASNPLVENSVIEDGFKLGVHFKPILELKMGSKMTRNVTIIEGSDVSFSCNIRSSPSVKWIGWSYNGKIMRNDLNKGVVITNQSLVLHLVKRNQSGHYQCMASNVEGRGDSNVIKLTVQHVPVCKPGQRIKYGISRHESGEIRCEVEAEPKDVTFRWWHNNSLQEPIDLTNFHTKKTVSFATYIPRTESEYGEVYCSASNRVGVQIQACVFNILPAGPPDPVQNCSITNKTFNSLTLMCHQQFNGGLKSHLIIEVYDNRSHRFIKNYTSFANSFTIHGLPSNTHILLVIYAKTYEGRSTSLSLVAATEAEKVLLRNTAVKQTERTITGNHKSENRNKTGSDANSDASEIDDVGNEAAVFVGVVTGTCILILITIVVVVLIASKKSHRNRRQAVEISTIEKKQTEDTSENADRQSPDVLPLNRNYLSGRDTKSNTEGNLSSFEILFEDNIVPVDKTAVTPLPRTDSGVVQYAELALSPPKEDDICKKEISRDNTQYAQLDFDKMNTRESSRCENTLDDIEDVLTDDCCLAPLMSNRMESCV